MKNYISFNIKYLCEKNFLTQKEFGELFSLKQSSIATYLSERSQPNIETLQKIALHFKISIDDFINRPLDQIHNKNASSNSKNDNIGVINENSNIQAAIENKIIDLLENALSDKQKIIESLENELSNYKKVDSKSKAV